MPTALDGIKIIDLSRMAPGPFCTMVLGDLGAEVIRVEEPGGGRMARERSGGSDAGEAARRLAFNALNRNKRSIALNLKSPDAQRVLHKLVEDADVFVEGFRPRVVSRLGCDYETLNEINPRLVYCSLSGYGQDGPYSNLVGHDINYISVGGALGVIGERGGAPVIPYNIIADYAGGGFHAATAILAALMARGHTGRGQYVDVAMSDGVMYMMASLLSEYFATGAVPSRGEAGLNGGAPYYNVYRCRDGRYISVGCIEPWFWATLCHAVGRDDLIDGQFDPARAKYVQAELSSVFATRDRDDWWREALRHRQHSGSASLHARRGGLRSTEHTPPHDHRRRRARRRDRATGRHRPQAVRHRRQRPRPRRNHPRPAHRRHPRRARLRRRPV